MTLQNFEFERDVKLEIRKKKVKGKVYEYETCYINVGKLTLREEFKKYVGKKVKVKVIVEAINEVNEDDLVNDLVDTYLKIDKYEGNYINAYEIYSNTNVIKNVMSWENFVKWIKDLRLKKSFVIVTWDFWKDEFDKDKYYIKISYQFAPHLVQKIKKLEDFLPSLITKVVMKNYSLDEIQTRDNFWVKIIDLYNELPNELKSKISFEQFLDFIQKLSKERFLEYYVQYNMLDEGNRKWDLQVRGKIANEIRRMILLNLKEPFSVKNLSTCRCVDILSDIKNFVKVKESVLSSLIEIQKEFCKAKKHKFSPIGILFLAKLFNGRITFKELFECRDTKCFIERLKPIPFDLFREMLSKLFYLSEVVPLIRFSRSFENDNIPIPNYIEPVGMIWLESWKIEDWVKKHKDEIGKILVREGDIPKPKPNLKQYFEALKIAFKNYWKNIHPSYAPLEELYNLINEELRKMYLSELTFDEHKNYIKQLKWDYKFYNCIKYYEGGINPNLKHWIYVCMDCNY